MTHESNRELETLVEARLAHYRPTGPSRGLRDRIVPTAHVGWAWAVAATLALATIGLGWATRAVEQQTAALLSAGEDPTPRPNDPRLPEFDEVPR
jgi:hypothetical protein